MSVCACGLSRLPHVLSPLACMRFHACHDFRTYNSCGLACAFAPIMLFACTISVRVHALFGLPQFPHVQFLRAYMQFPARHVFRMYYFCRGTCAFTLVTIFACTIPAGVHAVSGSSRFPHVQFLRAYMQFPARHVFRMYYFCRGTCAFRLASISARTISAGVHAVSGLSRFPHVLFPREDMRFRAYHAFRMYYFCRGTCTFRLVTFSAHTSHAGVHALFGLSHFPHVLFLPEYMRFPACHTFRTYYFRGKTCAFALVTISARTIPTGLHAVSGLPHFPHVQFPRACMRFRAYPIFRTY